MVWKGSDREPQELNSTVHQRGHALVEVPRFEKWRKTIEREMISKKKKNVID